MCYSYENEDINTLQNKSSDYSTRFIHKVPTNFHISQCVIEIGMRWLWELQGLGGDFYWNYNMLKTSYCTLFLYEFFLTRVSHRMFLMRQYQYKFICHISYFSTGVLYGGILDIYMSYLLFSPIRVFEKVSKTYNYNYDPQIIFILFSKLCYGFFLPRFPI